VLNIISHWENALSNHKEQSLHIPRKAKVKNKTNKQKT